MIQVVLQVVLQLPCTGTMTRWPLCGTSGRHRPEQVVGIAGKRDSQLAPGRETGRALPACSREVLARSAFLA